MKRHLALMGLLSVFAWLYAGELCAQSEPGQFHVIDIESTHPKAYHPTVGDLVQCYRNYIVVPGQIVDDLQVSVTGNSMQLVAVVVTRAIPGAAQVSAFLVPRVPGLATVKITPIINGQPGKGREMRFLVDLPQKSRRVKKPAR